MLAGRLFHRSGEATANGFALSLAWDGPKELLLNMPCIIFVL